MEKFINEKLPDSKNFSALDIGANIGNHSVFLSKFFKKIHSFEPNPKTYDVLSLNSKYSNTKKSFINFFFKLLKSNNFAEKPKVEESFIKINDSFILDEVNYQISILYEHKPIKIRKIIILEENQNLEISFFDHNNLEFFDKKFFSMIDPYLN